ncbi:MAG: hypothetical protein WDM86_03535 [Rhizomicrobium sp.]
MSAAIAKPDTKPIEHQKGPATMSLQDLNEQIQQAYKGYAEELNSAYADAQTAHAKAYLAYLDALHQIVQPGRDPTLEYWKAVLQAPQDAQATLDAHHKFLVAAADQQTTSQKAVASAATSYTQAIHEIGEQLQNDVKQHNTTIANTLKDAVLNANFNVADIPVLSAFYQGIRATSAAPESDTSTPS